MASPMSPFGALNSTPDTAQNYRGLLVAKITGVNLPITGPLARRKVYEWIEQTFDLATGAEIDPEDSLPRKGIYTSATQFDNCLLDANDATLTIGQFAWIRMKGTVTEITVYETVSSSGSDPTILIALTHKKYILGEFIKYTGIQVVPSDSPPIGYTPIGSNLRIYHTRNLDLPVLQANGVYTDLPD